jgi:MFS family permease
MRKQWLSLGGAMAGWMLDAMDWMMLALALPLIRNSFNSSLPQLGLLATMTLAGAFVGGIFSGILADYFGRVKMLMFTMIWYGVFTAACGFAQSYEQLLILRTLTGIGLGGEWGVGAALVSEYWPDRHRAKATCLVHSGWPLGYGLAAVAFIFITPTYGWRGLFWVGVIPAFIAIIVRLSVPEPELWLEAKKRRAERGADDADSKFPLATLFSRQYIRLTLLAIVLAAGALMAYQGAATWLPTYLAKTKGLNIARTGSFIIILNLGAFLGYQFFGWLADVKSRRFAFTIGMSGAIVATLIYVAIGNLQALLYFGPVFGFITYGFFGIFGAFISELFPTKARATATSLIFNCGRLPAMMAPYLIGVVAQTRGLGFGLGTTIVYDMLALVGLFFLPETVKAGVALQATIVGKSASAGK